MRCLLHFRFAGQDSIQFAECLKAGTAVLTRKLQPSIKVCCRYFQLEQVEGVQEHALVEPARSSLSKSDLPSSTHHTASPSIVIGRLGLDIETEAKTGRDR